MPSAAGRTLLGALASAAQVPSVLSRNCLHTMKSMRSGSGQGANRSDTSWYREDLQRRHGPEGAISCAGHGAAAH